MLQREQAASYAVIGLGVFGKSLALALAKSGSRVLGIDRDATLVERLSSQIDGATLDTTSEAALRSVDITSFDAVIVAIGADFEHSVLTTAALKGLGVGRVICQSTTANEREILARVGADRVVEPDAEAAVRLAQELMAPAGQEQMPLGQQQSVVTLKVPEPMAGQSLARLALDAATELTVLAIERDGEFLLWPPPDTSWQAGDRLVVMGGNEAVGALRGLF